MGFCVCRMLMSMTLSFWWVTQNPLLNFCATPLHRAICLLPSAAFARVVVRNDSAHAPASTPALPLVYCLFGCLLKLFCLPGLASQMAEQMCLQAFQHCLKSVELSLCVHADLGSSLTLAVLHCKPTIAFDWWISSEELCQVIFQSYTGLWLATKVLQTIA